MFKKSIFFIFFSAISFFGYSQHSINQFDSYGRKMGVWEKRYANGNLRYTGEFFKDEEVGVFKFYSEFYSTYPIIVKSYSKSNSACRVQFYTETGVLESEGQMRGKLRTGNWMYYNTTGEKIVLSESYVNGKLSGEKRIYYPDGTLTEVSYYRNGLLHGESLRYTDLGKLIAKVPYLNGEIHGKIYYYHNNGIIRETGFYDHGKRVGRWKFYIDGVLAGFEEPNKKVKKEPISLEEIEQRKKK